MSALHRAVGHGQRAADDVFHVEQFQADGGADDVDDGIDRPDFVEMDSFQGNAVYLSFSFPDSAENVV